MLFLRKIIAAVLSTARPSQLRLKNILYTPNRNAFFVFGFQKSGTSAIAGLLAERTGESVTIDTPYLWGDYFERINSGTLEVTDLVQAKSYPFSKTIFKEPSSTLIIPQLKTYFKMEKTIFICRDPFYNIKSILDRLGAPGNLQSINVKKINKNWRYMLFGHNELNYVENIATKWVEANESIHLLSSKSNLLVKYEDFKTNKNQVIDNIALHFGLNIKNDITEILDKPFQPKSSVKMTIQDFFGAENYDNILRICGPTAIKLGYKFKE